MAGHSKFKNIQHRKGAQDKKRAKIFTRFIKELSGENDSKERLGGTISSSLLAIMQGVQILRIHDVNEINQSIKVFNSLKF